MTATMTIRAFGYYLLAQGLTLLLAPNILLGFAHLPATNEPWIRLLGIALLALSWYYLMAAKSQLIPFYAWTVQVRIAQFIIFLGLILFAHISPIFLAFSGFELLTALWTAWALRREQSQKRAS